MEHTSKDFSPSPGLTTRILLGLGSRAIWVKLLLAATLGVVWVQAKDRLGDAPVYREAAVRWWNGEEFYRPDDPPAFTYPPLMVLAYAPFSHLPEKVGRTLWSGLNFFLLFSIVQSHMRLLLPTSGPNSEHERRRWLLVLLTTIWSIRFVISPLENQAHELILYWLIMRGLEHWVVGDWRAGIWIGLAAACKATPLLFFPVFLWRREFKTLAAASTTAVIATLLPDLISSAPNHALWGQSWYANFISKVGVASAPDVEGAWNGWNMLNQSLSGTLHRLFTPVLQPSIHRWDICVWPLSAGGLFAVNLTVKLAVLAAVAFATRVGMTRASDALTRRYAAINAAAAVMMGMLLLSPMSSKQHFCLLLTPIALFFTIPTRGMLRASIGGVLGFVLLFGAVAGKDILGHDLHREVHAYGAMTWCAVFCLAGTVVLAKGLAWTSAEVHDHRGSFSKSLADTSRAVVN